MIQTNDPNRTDVLFLKANCLGINAVINNKIIKYEFQYLIQFQLCIVQFKYIIIQKRKFEFYQLHFVPVQYEMPRDFKMLYTYIQ